MADLFSKSMRSRAQMLLDDYLKAWSIAPDGQLQTTDMDALFLEGILIQSIQQPAGLESYELEFCARKALKCAIRERTATVSRLGDLLSEQVKELKKVKPQHFALVTRCFFALEDGQEFEVQIGDAKAKFSQQAPPFDLKGFKTDGLRQKNLDFPPTGAYAVLPISARNPWFALTKASQALDVTFGALNFALHFGRKSLFSEGGYPPAIAFPGQHLGLFRTNGEPCDGHALYYTVTPTEVFRSHKDIPGRWDRVRTTLVECRVDELEYYETFWRLYFQCLSDADSDARAMKLWKVVEHLTYPKGSAKTDDVCSRMSVPFGDREKVSFIFEALRRRRNWTVHNSSYGVRRDEVFEVARELTERFVWRSGSTRDFPTLSDWQAFLELGSGGYSVEQLDAAAKAIKSRDGKAAG